MGVRRFDVAFNEGGGAPGVFHACVHDVRSELKMFHAGTLSCKAVSDHAHLTMDGSIPPNGLEGAISPTKSTMSGHLMPPIRTAPM